ncbi:MAG: phospholipase D-like domain-containing protein [Pseudomonadota bacterium]
MPDPSGRLFQVLLTAKEAYPALEAQFLQAEREVVAGFRVFDPHTRLRSDAARAVGDTWFDLIGHTLGRGVRITLILTDFDPVVRPEMHKYTWECVRGLLAAGEAAGRAELLSVRASMHPARVGWLPRLLLWPRLLKEMRAAHNAAQDAAGPDEDTMKRMPRLRAMFRRSTDGYVPKLRLPDLVPVTHHQKLAVFDRARLYIGGLDLNDRRYDTLEHARPAEETWHDVQVLVDGPVAQEAADHLAHFEDITQGAPPHRTVHLMRTISAKRRFAAPHLSPKPVVDELSQLHHDQIAQAQHLIYFETQFFRDTRLAEAAAARAQDCPNLSMILILPAAPEDAAFDDNPSSDVAYGEHMQAKSVRILRDGFGARLFVGSPAQPRATAPNGRATHFGAPIIYLHAKVSIFDDRCGVVSSANMNGRSMSWDTEAGIATQTPDEVAQLKQRCFDHWLGADAGPEFYDVSTACAAWAARAADNAHRAPAARQGYVLPYLTAPAEELARNLPGVPDEMV